MDFDENGHEGLASDGESESVIIFKNSFCTVGQKSIFEILRQKILPWTLVFFDFLAITQKPLPN